MLEVFSLNKVDWLPQYYNQYSPRDHFPLSLCCTLLCEVCVSVTLKAVGEVGWVHLLPVAIKIFCASHIYVCRTFCIVLSAGGNISYSACLLWFFGLGLGIRGQGLLSSVETKCHGQLPLFLESYLSNRLTLVYQRKSLFYTV